MTAIEIRAALVPRFVLGLTIFGEARGEPVEGKIAVGHVVRNRVRHRQSDYQTECLRPLQFSCWSTAGGAANHLVLMQMAERVVTGQPSGSVVFEECLYLADGVISGTLLDNTGGSLYYFAPDAMIPKGRVPDWAVGKPMIAIGSQRFVRA